MNFKHIKASHKSLREQEIVKMLVQMNSESSESNFVGKMTTRTYPTKTENMKTIFGELSLVMTSTTRTKTTPR